MLGEELAVGNAAPELRAKPVVGGGDGALQEPADMTEWRDDFRLPDPRRVYTRHQLLIREPPAPACRRPDTEKQQVDIEAAPVLQPEAGGGDIAVIIKLDREIPKLAGRKNRRGINRQIKYLPDTNNLLVPTLGFLRENCYYAVHDYAKPEKGSIPVASLEKFVIGVPWTMAEIDEQEMLKVRLEYLKTEHGDLDRAIDALIESGNYNTLQLQRLKKRKLVLKDQIFKTKNSLLPDIIA